MISLNCLKARMNATRRLDDGERRGGRSEHVKISEQRDDVYSF